MRRHAKAPSAGSTSGTGSGRRPFGRAFAIRGASGDTGGSGAPSRRGRPLSLALLLAAAALALAATPAAASQTVFDFFGSTGSGAGQFGTRIEPSPVGQVGVGGIAVNDTSGDVYVADRANNRIDQFDADGSFIRAWGVDVISNGAVGVGNLTSESKEVTSVVTTSKAFIPGQEISGTGIPAGTTITEVSTGAGPLSKLVLSQKATASGSGVTLTSAEGSGNAPAQNEQQVVRISATGGKFKLKFTTTLPTAEATTGDIVFSAPASGAGSVQEALEGLANIGAGNVAVTGSAGGPYTVEFKGTRFANTNVAQLTTVAGSTPLSGAGATSRVETTVEGAGRFEKCTTATSCQAGAVSGIAGGMGKPNGVAITQDTGNVYVTDQENVRVDEFDPSGTPIRAWGANVVESGPDNKPEVESVKAIGSSGSFVLSFGGKNTTATGTGTTASGSNEITALTSTGSGAFLVGEEISGAGVPVGTKITAVGAGTLTLSENATASASGISLTANLPAGASSALVEGALNALSSIGGSFGSVSVSGISPYQVTFGGIGLANSNVESIGINANGLGVQEGTVLPCAGGPGGGATISYEWLRNGEAIVGATSASYSTVALDAGKSIQCKVKATNGDGGTVRIGDPVTAAPFPSVAPPRPGSPSISSSSVAVGATLTCNTGSWSPGAPNAPTFKIQWQRNGEPIAGATSSTYTVQVGDNQTAIQCEVAGTNSAAVAVADSSNVLIHSEPPVNNNSTGNVPQVTVSNPPGGAPVPGATLSCSNGTWTVGSPSFAREWLKNGQPIAGATSTTYTVVEADKGTAIQCRVTATTVGGSGSAVSANKVIEPVPNPTPPVRPTAAITANGTRNVGQTLTCAAGKWTPVTNPETSFTYQWLRNGAPIGGASGPAATTYLLTAADLDKVIQCQVTATNVNGASMAISAVPGVAVPSVVIKVPPQASASLPSPSQVTTLTEGASAEICDPGADVCRAGVNSSLGGGFGSGAYPLGFPFEGYLAVAPGGPYAGDVFVADNTQKRIQMFTPSGALVGAFGRIAVESSSGNKQLCLVSLGDVCQNNGFISVTSGVEQYGFYKSGANAVPGEPPIRFTIDRNGAVYVANVKALQKYSPDLLSEKDFASPLCTSKTVTSENCADVVTDPQTGDVYVAYGVPLTESIAKEMLLAKLNSTGTAENEGEDPIRETVLKDAGVNPIGGMAIDGSTGDLRSGRIYLTTGSPEQRVVVLGEPTPPDVEIDAPDPEDIGTHEATFSGTINPNGNKLHTGYRFEYLRYGDIWTTYPVANVDIGNGTSPVAVEQTIPGLRANTQYSVRLTAIKGSRYASTTRSFTTKPAGPDVETGKAQWSGPPATGPSLTFYGTVDDNNLPVHYFFEYGSDGSYGNRVPIFETGTHPGAQEPFIVRKTINGLDLTTTYHYRLVARTTSGTAVGADRETATATATARFPELVSPVDKGVGEVGKIVPFGGQADYQADPAGGRLAYPFEYGDTQATAGGDVLEMASRDATDGWQNSQITPPSLAPPAGRKNEALEFQKASSGRIKWQSPHLSCRAVKSHAPLTSDTPQLDVENSVEHLFVQDDEGIYTRITPTPLSNERTEYNVVGGNPDCSRLVFGTKYRLLPGLPGEEAEHLYEWEAAGGANGTLRSADVLPDGSIPPLGAQLGRNSRVSAINSISPDASRFFFSTLSNLGEDNGKGAVFVRKNHTVTIDVSRSQTATPNDGDSTYQLASKDGSHVFFMARYGLATNGSSSGASECKTNLAYGVGISGCDLYAYNVNTGLLTDVSADANPADTLGAGVVGVYGAADDGSYVYFGALGQLIPGKGNTYAQNLASPALTSHTVNIYAWHEGTLTFVATSAQAAVANPLEYESDYISESQYQNSRTRVTPSGQYLLFTSTSNITGYSSSPSFELYRYSAPEGKVACVSCPPIGQLPHGLHKWMLSSFHNSQGISNYVPTVISNDGGTVIFSSEDKLTPDAIEGSSQEVRSAYEWHEGEVRLLAAHGKALDMSADGGDIYVLTSEFFVPQDQDFQPDVYDFRIGGGFPYFPPEPCDPLTENSCQGTPPPPPPPTPDPESSRASGPGNPPSLEERRRCRKGFVRKGDRCVKKGHKGRHRKGTRRQVANDNRGGSK